MPALARFTAELEIFSVDEAFLALSRCRRLWGTPREIAPGVKQVVFESSGILCSVGVSGDKTTAEFAAKQQKPDGPTTRSIQHAGCDIARVEARGTPQKPVTRSNFTEQSNDFD